MSSKNYSNTVRTITNELADIAKSSNQKKTIQKKVETAGQRCYSNISRPQHR